MSKEITVLNLSRKPDKQGDIIDKNCKIDFSELGKVTLNYKEGPENCLGIVNFKKLKTKVKAKIKFFDEHPMYTDLKAMVEAGIKLYPAIGGTIERKDGNKITKMKITELALCPNVNVDPNIKPIGKELFDEKRR